MQINCRTTEKCSGTISCGNPTKFESPKFWICSGCPSKIDGKNIIELENDIAKELQKVEDQNDLEKFKKLFEQYRQILHPNHYLIILLKRHIIGLTAPNFVKLDIPELTDIQQMCDEVRNLTDVLRIAILL